jgi:hypothetical protein
MCRWTARGENEKENKNNNVCKRKRKEMCPVFHRAVPGRFHFSPIVSVNQNLNVWFKFPGVMKGTGIMGSAISDYPAKIMYIFPADKL